MPTLEELLIDRAGLRQEAAGHIHRLLGSWQLIADLSFADLLLWCRMDGEAGFVCVGQMRPYTAQTLRPDDLFGSVVRPEEFPLVDRAFLERRTWQRDEPVLIDGIPVRMEAVPVPVNGAPIAVMTLEGAPLSHRRPGRLEQNYLECAAALRSMVENGTFPFEGESLDPETAPRVGDGFLRLDADGVIRYASPNGVSAYRRLGIISNIEGERVDDLGVDAASVRAALETRVPAEGDATLANTVVLQRTIPLLDPDERLSGGVVLVRDVTELRYTERMLQRKEAVIREIHHRVKNNLQTIASLLRLQARRLGSTEARTQLEEATRRIAAIAVVHETLSRETGELVDFTEVAKQIVSMVAQGLTHPDRRVAFDFEGTAGRLPTDLATPLVVALVELLQNAVEHAFGPEGGTVHIATRREADRLVLEVSDDGSGMPSKTEEGLGLQIVRALVETELEGTIELKSAAGTTVTLTIPVRPRAGYRF